MRGPQAMTIQAPVPSPALVAAMLVRFARRRLDARHRWALVLPALHLPVQKQRQLHTIVEIVRTAAAVERVILYGSHARGDWVDDSGYSSDFDICIVVSDPELAANHALWFDCQERAQAAAGTTSVSIVVHALDEVRHRLDGGCSYFRDIMGEGIVLYDAGHQPVIVPEMTPVRCLALAKHSLDPYLAHAAAFDTSAARNIAHGSLAIAAFELHQVVETLCKLVLVVFTAYVPKTHDSAELGRRCTAAAPDIGPVIPGDAPDRIRLEVLLRASYVEARYDHHFEVLPDELEALRDAVRSFRIRVEHACRRRIAELETL